MLEKSEGDFIERYLIAGRLGASEENRMEMKSGGMTVIKKLKYASVCGSLPKHNYIRGKRKGEYRAVGL